MPMTASNPEKTETHTTTSLSYAVSPACMLCNDINVIIKSKLLSG